MITITSGTLDEQFGDAWNYLSSYRFMSSQEHLAFACMYQDNPWMCVGISCRGPTGKAFAGLRAPRLSVDLGCGGSSRSLRGYWQKDALRAELDDLIHCVQQETAITLMRML